MLAFQIASALLFAMFFLSIGANPTAEHQQTNPPTSSISQTTATVAASVPQSCPVTQPPSRPFVPPSPYPSQHGSDGFWFGSDKLWVQLPTNKTWSHLPHYRPSDTAYRQKIQWWRMGYDWRTENIPRLTVTGRRLDSSAPPLTTDEHANNAGGISDHPSMMTGIFIPTLGCWQITGDYKADKLTFVIWVAQ